MKRFLLPHAFQKAGWWLLLASLVAGAAVLEAGLPGLRINPGNIGGKHNVDILADAAKAQPLTRVILAAVYLSLLLIACSREKVEDEMVSDMRRRAIAAVAYAAFALFTAITIVSTLTGADLYNGLALFLSSPTLLFWAYEAVFRISIARNRKRTSL